MSSGRRGDKDRGTRKRVSFSQGRGRLSSATGPRPRRQATSNPRSPETTARSNLLVRRAMTIGVFLLIVVLVGYVGYRLVNVAFASMKSSADSLESDSVVDDTLPSGDLTEVDSEDRIVIEPCQPYDLIVVPSLDHPVVSPGEGATVSVDFTNKSARQCSVDFGGAALKVFSGDQSIYDGTQCEATEPTGKTLLFTPGDTWSGQLTWDGNVYDGCTPVLVGSDGTAPKVGGPGTYRARVYIGGQPLGDDLVVQVQQPNGGVPPEAPAEESAGNSADEAAPSGAAGTE